MSCETGQGEHCPPCPTPVELIAELLHGPGSDHSNTGDVVTVLVMLMGT